MRLRSGNKVSEGGDQAVHNNKAMPDSNDKKIKIGKLQVDYTVVLVHFNIFLYSLCFWIQQGVFPIEYGEGGSIGEYLSAKLGSGSVEYGYLQTTFAVVQLCGGPIFGRIGDLYGGRAALTLAFMSAALSYGILGFADSISLLFVSRLPSLFMHAMQGGQMVVTDLADSSHRVTALSYLSISYGVGMVVGPLVGGQLAKFFGEQNAAFVACVGSLVSAAMCFTQIPKHTKKTENIPGDKEKSESKSTWSVLDPRKYLSLIKHETAFILLVVRFITGIPIGIFQSMFPMIAKDIYGLSAEESGFIISYIGVVAMLIQGIGMPILRKRCSEMQLIKLGVCTLIAAYFGLVYVQNVWHLVIMMAPLTFGLTVLTIVISAALTNSVEEKDTGTILGINMAVNSVIRTISPTIGGYILEWYGFPVFGYIGCVNSALMAAFLFVKFRGQ